MKAHIGVDAESGLIHTVECTTAKVADNVMLKDCLHGEESIVFADRCYHQNNRTIEHLASEDGLAILVPTKKPKGGELTEQQEKSNRILSAICAVVEHPFRVIKRQFGFQGSLSRTQEEHCAKSRCSRSPICGWIVSFDAYDREGAPVMREMKGRIRDSYGKR